MSCPTTKAWHLRGGACVSSLAANARVTFAPPLTPTAGYTVPLILITASSSPRPSDAPPLEKKSIGRSVKSKATPITSPSFTCVARVTSWSEFVKYERDFFFVYRGFVLFLGEAWLGRGGGGGALSGIPNDTVFGCFTYFECVSRSVDDGVHGGRRRWGQDLAPRSNAHCI